MLIIQWVFGVQVGYFDYIFGIEVFIVVVVFGVMVIEKYFILDWKMFGLDYWVFLELEELKVMVKVIWNIELVVGGYGKKELSDSEVQNKVVVRKSLYVQILINENEVILEKYFILLRFGYGILLMDWKRVVGRKVSYIIQEGQFI